MFHIRHWRYYKAYYNDPSPIGQHLVQAQKEHFDNEGMGVHLLNEQMDNIMPKLSNDVRSKCSDDSITGSSNTTMNDWTNPKYVLKKCTQVSCLWSELNNFIYSGKVTERP